MYYVCYVCICVRVCARCQTIEAFMCTSVYGENAEFQKSKQYFASYQVDGNKTTTLFGYDDLYDHLIELYSTAFLVLMASFGLFTTYLALIAFFYEQTNGFCNDPPFRYSLLKSLPIFALAALVYFDYTTLFGTHKRMHAAGLFFSACGDFIISMHDTYGFPIAAVLFGLGHLMYMAGYATRVRRVSAELLVPSLAFALFMNHFFLMPELPAFLLSTLVLMAYSLVLCAALVLTGSLYIHGNNKTHEPVHASDCLRFIGYGFFFVSDSILLLNHAGVTLWNPTTAVLSTYYAAQYLILWGAIESDAIAVA